MAIQFTVTFEDNLGKRRRRVYSLITNDMAQAQLDGIDIMGSLQFVTDAEILGGKLVQTLPPPIIDNNKGSANLSDNAVLMMQTVDGGVAPLRVPAAKAASFVANTPVVDTAFFSAFAAAVNPLITISDGELIDGAVGESGLIKGAWASVADR